MALLCAFQKPSNESDSLELVKLITSIGTLCPPIDLPWLECDTYLQTIKEGHRLDREANKDRLQQADIRSSVVSCNDGDNGTVTTVNGPKDYSHLYIYRNQQPVDDANVKMTDFISLPMSDDDDNYSDDDNVGSPVRTFKRTTVLPTKKVATLKKDIKKQKVKYNSANVGVQQANVAKKRRRF